MDYVVFGTGFGATLVLIGWVLRVYGPGLRYRVQEGDELPSAAVMVERLSWTRFVAALGAVLTTGGSVMLLATVGCLFIAPSDRAGTIAILSCFLLVLIGACVWAWVYIGRYGTHGIVTRRERHALTTSPTRRTAPRRRAAMQASAEAADQEVAPGSPAAIAGPAFVPAEESVDAFLAEAAEETDENEPNTPDAQTRLAADDDGDGASVLGLEVADAAADVAPEDGAPEASRADSEPVVVEPAPGTASEDAVPGDAGKDAFAELIPRIPRPSEASGRAEALRRLRQRRAERSTPEEE